MARMMNTTPRGDDPRALIPPCRVAPPFLCCCLLPVSLSFLLCPVFHGGGGRPVSSMVQVESHEKPSGPGGNKLRG